MQDIKTLFAEIQESEAAFAETEKRVAGRIVKLNAEKAEAQRAVEAAYANAAAWIAANPKEAIDPSTGELGKAVLLPSNEAGYVYKLGYVEGRESVKVADVDSLPEEFIRTKTIREADKKKIGEFLKKMDTLPNWASIERGEPKLTYKLVKGQL